MNPIEDRIHPREMRKYPGAVVALIVDLVNNRGVRYRRVDGQHLLLYAPDGSRPFKIAASRGANATIGYVTRWFEEHCE